MLKTVYAVGAAAIVAGAFVGFLSLSMQVEAHARTSAVKGDRADSARWRAAAPSTPGPISRPAVRAIRATRSDRPAKHA